MRVRVRVTVRVRVRVRMRVRVRVRDIGRDGVRARSILGGMGLGRGRYREGWG